jgi:hypothetical protein
MLNVVFVLFIYTSLQRRETGSNMAAGNNMAAGSHVISHVMPN